MANTAVTNGALTATATKALAIGGHNVMVANDTNIQINGFMNSAIAANADWTATSVVETGLEQISETTTAGVRFKLDPGDYFIKRVTISTLATSAQVTAGNFESGHGTSIGNGFIIIAATSDS